MPSNYAYHGAAKKRVMKELTDSGCIVLDRKQLPDFLVMDRGGKLRFVRVSNGVADDDISYTLPMQKAGLPVEVMGKPPNPKRNGLATNRTFYILPENKPYFNQLDKLLAINQKSFSTWAAERAIDSVMHGT